MKICKEYSPDQNYLLPPSLDEFVPDAAGLKAKAICSAVYRDFFMG